jgi:hypothetical protein
MLYNSLIYGVYGVKGVLGYMDSLIQKRIVDFGGEI